MSACLKVFAAFPWQARSRESTTRQQKSAGGSFEDEKLKVRKTPQRLQMATTHIWIASMSLSFSFGVSCFGILAAACLWPQAIAMIVIVKITYAM
jgi:hypothetical protein